MKIAHGVGARHSATLAGRSLRVFERSLALALVGASSTVAALAGRAGGQVGGQG